MISIVCFKWKRGAGYVLPHVCDYTDVHVNIWAGMIRRHLKSVPHELVCVTDDPAGIGRGIRIVPLWDDMRALGGSYVRLRAYAEDAWQIFGERFCMIDLDCVVTGDLAPLVTRSDPFVVNRYALRNAAAQHYNGSFVLQNAGARRHVWDVFRTAPVDLARRIEKDRSFVGTDQAVLSLVLGAGETTVGPEDGIHEAAKIRDRLPGNARIVFFSGARDPSQREHQWVRQHYRC